MNLQPFVDSRINPALPHASHPPSAVIVVGPIAAGKTTHRREKLGPRFVHVDSADIFHELSRGDATLDFPQAFAAEIEAVGRALTHAALDKRLNIAVETPGHDAEETIELVKSLQSAGYVVSVEAVAADRETCELRNATRGDNVSSYWAAPIHVKWIIQACRALAASA